MPAVRRARWPPDGGTKVDEASASPSTSVSILSSAVRSRSRGPVLRASACRPPGAAGGSTAGEDLDAGGGGERGEVRLGPLAGLVETLRVRSWDRPARHSHPFDERGGGRLTDGSVGDGRRLVSTTESNAATVTDADGPEHDRHGRPGGRPRRTTDRRSPMRTASPGPARLPCRAVASACSAVAGCGTPEPGGPGGGGMLLLCGGRPATFARLGSGSHGQGWCHRRR